jgi:hypothetical protein
MTQTISEVPVIMRIYGAGDLTKSVPYVFEGKIGSEIVRYGERFCRIHKGSITLGDQAVLFNAYLLSELGEMRLPENLELIIHRLFEERGRGNVVDNACDYDNVDRGIKKVKPTDRSVLWTIRPDKFARTGLKWKVVLGATSEQYPTLAPESGFVELTVDGAFMPEEGLPTRPRGVPFSTVKTRRDAEESWTKRGFTQEFAAKAVSYFSSRGEREGIAAIVRKYSPNGGRFCIRADYDPDGYSDIGSFPMSTEIRSSARSSARAPPY